MINASAWARLPAELRALPQWVVAGASKAPMSVDANGKLYLASVVAPNQWLTFEQAAQLAWNHRDMVTTAIDKLGKPISQTGLDIGFILNEADTFSCIDLDVKDATNEPDPQKWTTAEQFDFYWRIVQTFDSYTERSRSGKGLHAWVKGKIGSGFRRDGIEVYSQERFIICTGDVVLERPVQARELMLTNMVSQMRPARDKNELEELPPYEDDWSVLTRAVHAKNKDKFIPLWMGDWRSQGFPSQSEADLALMSMFAFYSKSNQQVRELFWQSGLGQREKAYRMDYINDTLRIIRNRQTREANAEAQTMQMAADLKQQLNGHAVNAEIARMQGGVAPQQGGVVTPLGTVEQRTTTPLHVTNQGEPQVAQAPVETLTAQMSPVNHDIVSVGKSGIPWPPGLMGAIAQYIYQGAHRPVKEVAIIGALGLMAGLCGKAWHIPKSGLNLYIILVARSAIGKEAMHGGIAELVTACKRKNPFFGNFVDFTEYVSGPALLKACLSNTCFVNVSGEWGRRLKRIAADERPDGPTASLRTQMTNLYQKSAPTSMVGGMGYSSADNNVATMQSVSYSLIGETTPETFYEALTPTMMEDGFMSRFITIAYEGQRPPPNNQLVEQPSEALVEALCRICQQAQTMMNSAKSVPVARDEAAASILNAFEYECDTEINSTDDESRRQMWNRAALKVLRISALLAVADNYTTPCINATHVNWAIDVIRRDIALMKGRLDSGDVGSNDMAREKKLVAIMKSYLTDDLPKGYKIPDGMQQNSIIPRNYIQVRAHRSAAFYNHKFGANKAMEDAISNLIVTGRIMEVSKDKLMEFYNYTGKAYRILDLPDYDLLSRS